MTRLFERSVTVTVGTHQFLAGRTGLRVAFKVAQSLDSKQNSAEAVVSNLAESSRGQLAALKRPAFIIEAGYRETIGTVFVGTAIVISSTRDSPGFSTKISASDGGEGKRVVNTALAPGATVAQAIETLADAAGLSARRAIADARAGKFDGAAPTFFSGIVLCGAIKHEMDKLAGAGGFDWTIQNGELVLLRPNDTTTETAVLLDEHTGLIGSPERIVDKKHPKRVLYKVRSLLQPNLRPGRRVAIESAELRGEFKCLRVTHDGDTHGPGWYSDCEVIEVKA